MFWIIWYVFTVIVILAALLFIPLVLYWQSQCVSIKVVNSKGEPLIGVEVFGVYDETAYATSIAGSYGGENVYSRTAISTSSYQKFFGKTDALGNFKTRIWFGKYWGLKVQQGEERVSVLLDRFSQSRQFATQPKHLVFDTNRSMLDPRWCNGE